ncbi:MAG: hypothetical protein DYG86_09985 [Chloroflexi bacterium CFX2]|nr:hypothetical protein [Chloroflexi bacterium CFX2]
MFGQGFAANRGGELMQLVILFAQCSSFRAEITEGRPPYSTRNCFNLDGYSTTLRRLDFNARVIYERLPIYHRN